MLKPEGATGWSRYDVVGWGLPVRANGWDPDGRWYGDTPRVPSSMCAARHATALIPKVKAAIEGRRIQLQQAGDYKSGRGPTATHS